MFRLSQKGSIQYYEAESLGALEFLRHAFLARSGGISRAPFASLNVSIREGDLQEHVDRNFQIAASGFGLEKFFLMSQVHGDRILVLREGEETCREGQPQADAVMTSERGIAIGIKTADCVPVLLADPVKRVIAAVHAGWRGTALQIVSKTVLKFISEFSTCPEDIIAAIGPAIGPCCYEVDLRVFEAMNGDDRQHVFKQTGTDQWKLDLAELNRRQLLKAGLPEKNISAARLCTACRADLFFSHRKEGRTGRQLNFILLR